MKCSISYICPVFPQKFVLPTAERAHQPRYPDMYLGWTQLSCSYMLNMLNAQHHTSAELISERQTVREQLAKWSFFFFSSPSPPKLSRDYFVSQTDCESVIFLYQGKSYFITGLVTDLQDLAFLSHFISLYLYFIFKKGVLHLERIQGRVGVIKCLENMINTIKLK